MSEAKPLTFFWFILKFGPGKRIVRSRHLKMEILELEYLFELYNTPFIPLPPFPFPLRSSSTVISTCHFLPPFVFTISLLLKHGF